MKIKATSALLLSLLLLFSCEIDNYDRPQVTVTGKIVDSQTNKLVESGGINAGSVVRFYEGTSRQPLVFNTLPDGTFSNSKMFAGNYSYTAEGPFKLVMGDPQETKIEKDAQVEVKVIPNVRLEATVVEATGTTAKIKVKYEKIATNQKLVHLAVVWSKFPNPNNFTFSGGAINLENIESLNLTAGEKIFTLNNLTPGTKYYVRASARTANPGNYYNYSTQLELPVQ